MDRRGRIKYRKCRLVLTDQQRMSMQYAEIVIGGVVVLVEVEQLPSGQATSRFEGTSAASTVAPLKESLEKLVQGSAGSAMEAMKLLRPDEIAIELSVGFKAEGNVPFLARGESNANIKISAKWKPQY
jgi:hypothetical protein